MAEPLRLLVAHANADQYAAELEQRFPDVEIRLARDPQELDAAKAFPATVAYSCVGDGFPREAHARLREHDGLAWIHVGGSGCEHFLAGGNGERLLTNGAGVLAPFLAEMLIGALFALNLGLPAAVRDQLAKTWRPRNFRTLQGRTLAIVGTGAVGSALAERARLLGLEVVGVARRATTKPHFDAVRPLDELVGVAGACDFLSLNVALTPVTRHLVDTRVLAAMRPEAFLLNAARGAVVDEAALIEALAARRIAGAYLDVFETEPLPETSPLWTQDNVLMTAHCSDRVVDWELRHARFFMDNLARWQAGEQPLNQVARI